MKDKILHLHPSQIAIGFQEAKEGYIFLTSKSKTQLERYIETHPIPVVKGKQNRLYIIDNHTLCSALYIIDPEMNVCIDIIDDLSHVDDFWQYMCENKYTWLYNEHGRELSISEFVCDLPSNVTGLKNDPYKALVSVLCKRGVFEKYWTPFSEFKWANFLRERIQLADDLQFNFDHNVVDDACEKVKTFLHCARLSDI